MDWNTIITKLIETNPNVLATFVSVFLVPVVILYLSNRHQKQLKELEKKLEESSKKDLTKESQEDLAYAALAKILFDVQRLYTDLSLPTCDPDCINRALEKFRSKLFLHQAEIAENQLRLSPKLIEKIYEFYGLISTLEIELVEFKIESYDFAKACVSINAEKMAQAVIDYHKEILRHRSPTRIIEATDLNHFRTCCGGGLSPELRNRYNEKRPANKTVVDNLVPTPIPNDPVDSNL